MFDAKRMVLELGKWLEPRNGALRPVSVTITARTLFDIRQHESRQYGFFYVGETLLGNIKCLRTRYGDFDIVISSWDDLPYGYMFNFSPSDAGAVAGRARGMIEELGGGARHFSRLPGQDTPKISMRDALKDGSL
jgi:hypothetical protein